MIISAQQQQNLLYGLSSNWHSDPMTAELTPDLVTDVIARDPDLPRLVRDLRPDPPDQPRLFRGHLIASGESCVLKVGLGELEADWMPAMSSRCTDVVADVLGHGILPELDQNWLLMSYLPYRARSDRHNDAIGVMQCAARFQQTAIDLDLPTYPIDSEFLTLYTKEAIANDCPGPAATVLARIDEDDAWLRSLGGHTVGHGDVHFWNAVASTPNGPWRLILLTPFPAPHTGPGTPPTPSSPPVYPKHPT